MAKRKKILFVIESLSGGGAEKILSVILRNTDTARFDVTLCCIVNTGQYLTDIPEHIKYKYIIPDPDDCKSSWDKWIYRLKYKLVYSWLPLSWVYRLWIPKGNDFEVAFVEGFATKLISKSNSRAKKVAWLHTDYGYNHWTTKIYRNNSEENNAYSAFDSVICVSEIVEQSLLKLYPNLKNTVVKHNPIDDRNIRQLSRKPATIILPIGDTSVKLVSTGRLVHQKGYDRLLPIVKRLIDDGLNVSLTILGEGGDRYLLEEYIGTNDLSGRVSLPGFVGNPYAVMARHDVFVCSSRAEGYSTAVTEALILGLPVVTTECSGMKELLGERNEYGIVTPNDDEALYQAVKSIVTDVDLLRSYKSKAEERGKDFSLSRLMKPIEEIFE